MSFYTKQEVMNFPFFKKFTFLGIRRHFPTQLLFVTIEKAPYDIKNQTKETDEKLFEDNTFDKHEQYNTNLPFLRQNQILNLA